MSEINLTPLVQQQSTSRLQFIEKYWFDNYQMVTVVNPFEGDVVFMHEMRNYVVKAGQDSRLPGAIANLYLELVARTMAQNDNDLGAIGDPAKCGAYYDKLIVKVESSAPEYDTNSTFSIGQSNKPVAAPVQPFQSENFTPPTEMSEPIPPLQSSEPQLPPAPQPSDLKPGESREFMLGDDAFAKVMSEAGDLIYMKNGAPITVTDYAKAVSML